MTKLRFYVSWGCSIKLTMVNIWHKKRPWSIINLTAVKLFVIQGYDQIGTEKNS